MSENRELTEKGATATATPASPKPERALQPPVDICESAEGISLWVDMPGVARDALSIQVDRETLVIEGEARLAMPEGMKSLYADVRSTLYRRSFALSSELDTDHIEASLKDGVLNLRIHKRPESRPRRIDVLAG